MFSEVQLLGVTYSEFDNKVGPQLKYSYPPDVLSKEAFEAYSDYVIVSKQLCEKVIVATFDDVQFLNYSVAIDNAKYHRNALLFAFGFVLLKGVDIDPYCKVLEKISSTVVNLEIETEFLYQQEGRNKIQDFLRVLFFHLNEKNEAFVDLGLNNSYLAVKLYRSPVQPPEVMDFEVPIFRKDRIDLSNLPWDISFQHLIPYIDGISHVKKIVYEVGMDIDSVKRSLKLLQFHDAIIMADVFKFTNVYKINTNFAISQLSNPIIMQEMRQFSAVLGRGVAVSGTSSATVAGSTAAVLPSTQQLVAFLLRLQPNRSIQQILLDSLSGTDNSDRPDSSVSLEYKTDEHRQQQNSPSSPATQPLNLENIDIARLLAFARAHGLIRRVYEYPIHVSSSSSSPSSFSSSSLPSAVSAGGLGDNGGKANRLKDNNSVDSLSGLGWRNPSPALSSASSNTSVAASLDAYGGGSGAASGTKRSGGGGHPSSSLHNPHHIRNPLSALHPLMEEPSGEGKSSAEYMAEGFRRSNNVPVSAPSATAPALSSCSSHHFSDTVSGSSVGLSGVLSTGTSLNTGHSGGFVKGIGARRISFEPENREKQQQLESQNRNGNSNSTSTNTAKSSVSNVSPTSTVTSVNPANSSAPPPRTLSRHYSRSKMTAGHNFLQMNNAAITSHQHSLSNAVPPAAAAAPTNRFEVRDILHKLNGKENIDSICCRYELSYQDIVNFPGVKLIYK